MDEYGSSYPPQTLKAPLSPLSRESRGDENLDSVVGVRSDRMKISCDPPQKVVVDGEVLGNTPVEVEVVPGETCSQHTIHRYKGCRVQQGRGNRVEPGPRGILSNVPLFMCVQRYQVVWWCLHRCLMRRRSESVHWRH